LAALRGHHVTLAEALPELGGTLTLAARAPTRQQFGDYIHWLQQEVYTAGVKVQLSTYVMADDLVDYAADHIIMATGAEPRMDGLQMSHPGEPIEGIDLPHVRSSNDLFDEKGQVAASHALADGRAAGCSV